MAMDEDGSVDKETSAIFLRFFCFICELFIQMMRVLSVSLEKIHKATFTLCLKYVFLCSTINISCALECKTTHDRCLKEEGGKKAHAKVEAVKWRKNSSTIVSFNFHFHCVCIKLEGSKTLKA
jgi:hypothetical protein